MTGRIKESDAGKRSHAGLTLLNVMNSSTKGFLEIFSHVLAAQAYLSGMEGQISHVVALH